MTMPKRNEPIDSLRYLARTVDIWRLSSAYQVVKDHSATKDMIAALEYAAKVDPESGNLLA